MPDPQLDAQDPAGRGRGDDALRESEERFRLLVSSVVDYAIYLLDPDGTVASWNLGAQRLKGYSADEIIGRHLSTFYTEQDRLDGLPDHALKVALDDGRWEQEGWRVRKDGSQFWANVVITALAGPDGDHRGFAKVTRDLTDRKRNDDALLEVLQRERDAADRLRELDRMRGDLMAMITHDLRAPIGVLQHLIKLSREEGQLTAADADELTARMADKTDLLASLVDDVFEMTLLEADRLAFDLGPVDLDRLLDQLADDLVTASERSVSVRGDRGICVRADHDRLWQVLQNLLSNAVKYSPVDEPIAISTTAGEQTVRVAVTDHGPGIPADHRDDVFEPFRRLDSAARTPGSGLGLHIARLLMDGQGGRIWVEETPGGGATFVAELARVGVDR